MTATTQSMSLQELKQLIRQEIKQGISLSQVLDNHDQDFRHLSYDDLIYLAKQGMRAALHWDNSTIRTQSPTSIEVSEEQQRLIQERNALRQHRHQHLQDLARRLHRRFNLSAVPGDLGALSDQEFDTFCQEFERTGNIRAKSNRDRRRVNGAIDNMAVRISLWLGKQYCGKDNRTLKDLADFTKEDTEAQLHRMDSRSKTFAKMARYFERQLQLMVQEEVEVVRDLSRGAKEILLQLAEELKLKSIDKDGEDKEGEEPAA